MICDEFVCLERADMSQYFRFKNVWMKELMEFGMAKELAPN